MSSPILDVRDVARLARIELTDEEAATFQSQLGRVLEYVEQLGKLDVSGVEPTAHANPVGMPRMSPHNNATGGGGVKRR